MRRTAIAHPEGFTFLSWSGVDIGVLEERLNGPLLKYFLSPRRQPEWLRGHHACEQVVLELLGPECLAPSWKRACSGSLLPRCASSPSPS